MLSIVFNFCYYATLVLVPIIIFVFFSNDENFHSKGGLLFFVKYFFGRRAVRKFQKNLEKNENFFFDNLAEEPKCVHENESDRISFVSSDQNGNQLNVNLSLKANHKIEQILFLRINGEFYILPDKGDDEDDKSTHKVCSSSVSKYRWNCNGLNVEILEPFKRCRLTFNGFLKNISSKNYGRIQHLKFNFIWNCCCKPNMAWIDDDLDLLTNCLAKAKWKNGQWLELLGDEKGYNQFGALKGQISINGQKEIELNMTSIRKRYWGIEETKSLNKYITIFAATENGILLHLGVKSLLNGCPEIKFGHVLTRVGAVFPIRNSDLKLNMAVDQLVSGSILLHLRANKKVYKLVISTNKKYSVELKNRDINGFTNKIISAECNINNDKGMAVINYWQSFTGTGFEEPTPLLRNLIVENIPKLYAVNLEREEAKILELTGGKGNALALMTNNANEEIIIPDGFVVTTVAFRQQIQNNLKLKESLLLLSSAVEKKKDDLKEICRNTVAIFDTLNLIPSVANAVRDELTKLKRKQDDENNNNIPFLRWAVRSSAIGEDSDDHSSAGQNDTFLGCQTDEEVLSNISKCWGSLFSYQSVVYRRQHHQPIISEMAVVVQKMIPAESAGVLFTCDPYTNNPTKMVISSNFGLGETVVSGQIEPDTIILSRTYQEIVKFHSFTLGSKSHSLIMNRHGIHKNITDKEKSKRLSLTKERALKIGSIGVYLEKIFGTGPVDVEWAFFEDTLYILQCRPVTESNPWTDYELIHEFDSPHISNDMFYTRANIGEVLPFPLTALTQSTLLKCLERGYQIRMFGKYDPHVSLTFGYSHHFAMIELVAGLYARPRKEIELAARMVDLAVFGHPVLNDEINKKALARYGIFSDFKKYKEILLITKYIWQAPNLLEKLIRDVENLDVNLKGEDSLSRMYEKIDRILRELTNFSHSHCLISTISIVYQTVSMLMLMEGEKEITLAHFKDLNLILSSCENVISAEIPNRLEEMVNTLRESGLAERFSTVPPSNGVEWLKNNSIATFELFQKFLIIHGHRLYGEMELSLNTWAKDPAQVVRMIQINCKREKAQERKDRFVRDAVDQLELPKNNITRKILKFILSKQRISVGNREKSKSALVKAVDKLRSAYGIMADKMVSEGFLPSKSLIFHLTHHEIWQIINKKNNSQLITKATKRQRLYPTLSELKFPEIMFGMAVPEENGKNCDIPTSGTIIVNGTPVCSGEVTGRACVITSLDEIKLLREGDILITRSTDIGWSPYFPILSGIVTELGGLVSHGAVVAREYGLPCLVGVKNATKMFKTGDKVVISGQKGTLIKITH